MFAQTVEGKAERREEGNVYLGARYPTRIGTADSSDDTSKAILTSPLQGFDPIVKGTSTQPKVTEVMENDRQATFLPCLADLLPKIVECGYFD